MENEMTQAQQHPENEPDLVIDTDSILEKKAQNLNSLNEEETYLIKRFNNGKLEEAYDGILNFSTPEGKAEFNTLQMPNNNGK